MIKSTKTPAFRVILAICLGLGVAAGCELIQPGPPATDEDVVYVHGLLGSDSNPGNKDAPFQTIQAAVDYSASLQPSPEVRVAAGTYSSDYRTASSPVLTLKEGVELYGGYSASNWALRDPALYATVIEDASSSGGDPADPNRAVAAEPGVTALTLVDGFVIRGGAGDLSFAVFLVNASPRLRDCRIEGGSGLTFSVGVYNYSSSSPAIENNTILGGTANSSFGIYNYTGCAPLIEGNRISGGGSGSQSLGIYNDSWSPALIRNNLIDGGGGAYSIAIMNFDSSPVIRNNTICGGHNSASWTVAMLNQTAQPVIQNNIVFTTAGAGRYGIYEFDAAADPGALQNNNIFDCPSGLYYDYDGTAVLSTAAELNDYTLTTQNAASPSAGNIAEDALLVDPDGADDDLLTIEDNDWRLSASSPAAVVSGGLNGAHSTAGWGYTTDLNGGLRSPLDDSSLTGWSMGAYEAGGTGRSMRALVPSVPSAGDDPAPRLSAPQLPVPLHSTR